MSLKINRQSDLDELFSKFAVEPGKEPKKEEPKEKDAHKKPSDNDKSRK